MVRSLPLTAAHRSWGTTVHTHRRTRRLGTLPMLVAALTTIVTAAGCTVELDRADDDPSAVCAERSGALADQNPDGSIGFAGVNNPGQPRAVHFRRFNRCMEELGATCTNVTCNLTVGDDGSAAVSTNVWVVCDPDPSSPPPSTTTLPGWDDTPSGLPVTGCPDGTVARPPAP